MHRQKNSSLLASIPLSSVFLSLYHSCCTRAFWGRLAYREDWQGKFAEDNSEEGVDQVPYLTSGLFFQVLLIQLLSFFKQINSFQLCTSKVRSFPQWQRGRRWDWRRGKKRQKACLCLLIRKVGCFHLKRNILQDHVFVKYLGSVDGGNG